MKHKVMAVTAIAASVLAPLPAAAAPSPAATATVRVDPAATHQTIDGFGGSGAFRVSSVMHGSTGLSPAKQRELLDLLFSPTTGAGLSILRNEIGSSTTACTGGPDDGDSVCSIEPDNPGGPNEKPAYVWDGGDTDQVWLTRQAKTRGLRYVEADAWSAPAYMKTNGTLGNGGYLCGLPGATACASGDWRQHYADYLTKYVQLYRKAGLPVDYLAYGNEVDLASSYTGMNWDATNVPGQRGDIDPATPQNIDFIGKYLGPTLARAGLDTKVACCEATSWDHTETYADGVLADPKARKYLGVVTGHAYWSAPSGSIGANPIESAQRAGKKTWETETSDFTTYNPTWAGGNFATSGMQWALNIQQALVDSNVSAYLYWTLSWQNSPATADNGNLTLVDGPNDTYYVPKRLWAFAGFSRYVRPGAIRIDAVSSDPGLKTSAFRNRDGSYVVVAINTTGQAVATDYAVPGHRALPYLTDEADNMAAQPALRIAHGTFTATVPAMSMVTFRIMA